MADSCLQALCCVGAVGGMSQACSLLDSKTKLKIGIVIAVAIAILCTALFIQNASLIGQGYPRIGSLVFSGVGMVVALLIAGLFYKAHQRQEE